MKHLGTKTIKTERLVLRKVRFSDAEKMYINWQSDERVTKYLSWKPYPNIETSYMITNKWLESYKDKSFYLWVIVLKDSKIPIGTISAMKGSEDWNMSVIGYCIGFNWWNKGYTTEAMQAVMNYMFNRVGVNKIMAYCDKLNVASYQVMLKNGLKYDGMHYNYQLRDDYVCDAVICSVLKTDYVKDKVII